MNADTKMVKIWGRFAPDLILDCDDEGAQNWWKYAMQLIADSVSGCLRCNLTPENCLYSKLKGMQMQSMGMVGEYGASMGQVYWTNEINVPLTCAEVRKEADGYHIKFADENHFGIFMHEVGHFEHFVKDKGMCISPAYLGYQATYEDHDEVQEFIHEYEAGYRSILWQKKFKVFPDKPDLLKIGVNVGNLFKYWMENMQKNNPDWYKKYQDACHAFIGFSTVEEKEKMDKAVVAEKEKALREIMDTKLFTQFKEKWSAYASDSLDLSFLDIGVIK